VNASADWAIELRVRVPCRFLMTHTNTPPSSRFRRQVCKRVLVLAGANDKLVPWETSRTFVYVEALDVGRGGRKVVMVVPGVKHEFTKGIREKVFRFFGMKCSFEGLLF
jgi:hypothetical protein